MRELLYALGFLAACAAWLGLIVLAIRLIGP